MSRRRLLFPLIATLVLSAAAFVGNVFAGNVPSLGLDLQGGASVTMTPKGDYEQQALDVAVEIIRQRVDSIGVAEPEIQRQGDSVVVNLPGVKDQQKALDLIGRTGAVEMRPVVNLAENPDQTTTTTAKPGATTTTSAGGTSTLPPPAGGVGSARISVDETTTTVAASEDEPDLEPVAEDGGELKPGQTILPGRKDGLIYLLGPAEATGEVFNNDPSVQVEGGSFSVVANLKSGPFGEDLWNSLARKCYDGGEECPTKQIAIVLDGEVISAPTVQTPTFSGSVSITGGFTRSEADELAKILQFGAVPVQFDIPTVQTVSATLGKDSLNAAIISGLFGVLLVLAYLIFYYRLIGAVVIAGIGITGILLWSVVSWLSKTNGLALTLSGAAGIIVSVGVTVDSYVVFFERLKDDVQAGRTLRNSASRGFDSAWRTILIADTASLIGALVLWWLTVGAVRGFAFFLGLSTLIDLIVSYTFTRPLVLLLARTKLFNNGKVLGVREARATEEVA